MCHKLDLFSDNHKANGKIVQKENCQSGENLKNLRLKAKVQNNIKVSQLPSQNISHKLLLILTFNLDYLVTLQLTFNLDYLVTLQVSMASQYSFSFHAY
jgi:hypothetical protein